MSNYAVIVENDESQWDDRMGEYYHYPSNYKNILKPGVRVVYYKGRQTNKNFSSTRLSPEPHYFGTGTIGESTEDTNNHRSKRKNWYCNILDFCLFDKAVSFKREGEYLEDIPKSVEKNYWRNGVRPITESTYNKITSDVIKRNKIYRLPSLSDDLESESLSREDGAKNYRYSSRYERNPVNRKRAIEIHGYTCMACSFNFEDNYGDVGKEFIHVHHNKPVSETGPTKINASTDLSVLCPNCHWMIHRNKKETLRVNDLKVIIAAASVKKVRK